jgi:hypothetical protein
MQLIKLFPMRGDPPPDQPGYTRDPGQPFIFRMTWIPCTARKDITLCKACPGSVIDHQCDHFKKQVDQNVCKACGGIDAVTQRLSEHKSTSELLSIGVHANQSNGVLSELPGLPSPNPGNHEGQSMPYVPEN